MARAPEVISSAEASSRSRSRSAVMPGSSPANAPASPRFAAKCSVPDFPIVSSIYLPLTPSGTGRIISRSMPSSVKKASISATDDSMASFPDDAAPAIGTTFSRTSCRWRLSPASHTCSGEHPAATGTAAERTKYQICLIFILFIIFNLAGNPGFQHMPQAVLSRIQVRIRGTGKIFRRIHRHPGNVRHIEGVHQFLRPRAVCE